MSGSRPEPTEGHLAEQHLGDRLAALVDGELGHEARERVLAHLATCSKCKAEADAQRRLKDVFAAAAPPPPSESFLARLQGLPGGDDGDGDSPLGGFADGLSGRAAAAGVFGVKRSERFEFGYVPARAHDSVLPSAGRGFRIHDVSRHEAERSASRGVRFAVVAAGAVSLAAIALGGVTTGTGETTNTARDGSGGSNVTPLRTQGSGAATAPENQRRRGVGPLLAQGGQQTPLGEAPVAPTAVSAPLLPGIPAPAGGQVQQAAAPPLTTPVAAGAAAMSPLIRPLSSTPPFTLTTWSTVPKITNPGLFAAPVPDPASSPTTPSGSPGTGH
ncbi:anti-sigma factor family protein [Streptomyces blattellae]|uniref:anti-sigma factor family protein n=1 Tax=Streptomyces blattellae TaxID=2569855 RepID=UPI0012B84A41|nr:zf-HC2 domain-containing protein [Streptomyces blattellae]